MKTTMTIQHLDTQHAMFNNQDPDGPPADTAFTMPRATWFEMGAPVMVVVEVKMLGTEVEAESFLFEDAPPSVEGTLRDETRARGEGQ